ncbi:MAG TPA: hypothetical protein IAB27_05335 [Candidatus Coprosoma intestinipullorum]|uniref:Uncharacterized protein n=1 Tax=Candidatus Coprosoma intestinipullorum TaxID=2840752 RepID=A0A9D0ZRE5_9FIRM|nr:hypothetical protein [Candidatus Coprosoma intestinipullorum]
MNEFIKDRPTSEQLVEILDREPDITICSDIVHGLDYEYKELKKENQELKNQQKEFMEWLENESKELIRDAGYHQRICLEILDKYKEIIGGDNK